MKTLLILRHAKSSWANESLADHDRPLNERGKRDAPRMGRLLRDQGFNPTAILCSTAKRARSTAKRVLEASGCDVDLELCREFYHALPDAYVELLQQQADQHPCILVIGHNPALQDLVGLLTGEYESFPTAALAHVELPIDRWQELSTNTSGALIQLWRPKELED
jgi:phosphohistidine phosphatase